MPGTMDSIATVNSFLRTLLVLLGLGGLSAASWYGYSTYNAKDLAVQAKQKEVDELKQELDTQRQQLDAQREQIQSLEETVEQQALEIDRLSTSLRLLKVNVRLARLSVLEQQRDQETGQLSTLVEFVEIDQEGDPIEQPRQFRVRGDVVYVDNWIVKFDDEYVEQAAVGRSTSLVLFRRLFGEYQEPNEGYPLDQAGRRPAAYAQRGQPSELEQKIWSDFWEIANDEGKAAELGIRAAHGEAVSIKVRPGKSYKVLLRASDGLSIVPESDDGPGPPKT